MNPCFSFSLSDFICFPVHRIRMSIRHFHSGYAVKGCGLLQLPVVTLHAALPRHLLPAVAVLLSCHTSGIFVVSTAAVRISRPRLLLPVGVFFFRSDLRSPSDSDGCSTSVIPVSKNSSSFSLFQTDLISLYANLSGSVSVRPAVHQKLCLSARRPFFKILRT